MVYVCVLFVNVPSRAINELSICAVLYFAHDVIGNFCEIKSGICELLVDHAFEQGMLTRSSYCSTKA